jgi:hypothetical protein
MSKSAIAVIFISISTAGTVALASPSPSPDGERACQHIVSACEAAGYVKDATQKNLSKDCMQPILVGKSVPQVTVDAKDVAACNEYRAAEKSDASH